jgi:K+-sensing histidine kinase KdpD
VYTSEEKTLAGGVARLASLVIERERLLREQAQARANELALIESTQRMNTFLGIASHEMKTPLTVIKGNLQLVSWNVKRIKNHRRAGFDDADEQIASLSTMIAQSAQH